MIDDIFVSDRTLGEVAAYRAAMSDALVRRLRAGLSLLLPRRGHALGRRARAKAPSAATKA